MAVRSIAALCALLGTIALCLLVPTAARDLPARSLLQANGSKPGYCPVPLYGADIPGHDLPFVDNVPSYADCCRTCAITNGCVAFVWIAIDGTKAGAPANPGAVLNRCYLKSATGPVANLDWGIAGVLTSPPAVPVSVLNVGQDLPGNDASSVPNIGSARQCSDFCAATDGCVAFVYVDITDPTNSAATAGNCYLKNKAGAPAAYPFVTSGVVATPANGTTYALVPILYHSDDERDTAAVPLEGFFLLQQDPNNPGSALASSQHVPRVFLLAPLPYNNVKQVDWYIHKPSTVFTDPTQPPVGSSRTATAAPYYLGTTANAAGGQGTTYDIQGFRQPPTDGCGLPGNGGKCTATVVATLNDGTKFITARNTFYADLIPTS